MSLRTARRLVSGSIVLCLLAGIQVSAQEPRIAVIIDDVGYQLSGGQRSIGLPGPVVLAILPHTPWARQLAEDGFAAGKEILVHMPMQASDTTLDPGPGALELANDPADIDAALSAAIAAVPHASGVSNHMGSLVTRDPGAMRAFMRSLSSYDDMIFIDSYTTHLSVALMSAREHGITALKRDVFLDTESGPEALEQSWNRLLELARTHGFAVGIAHPHSATLEFLEQRIAELTDVELVPLHQLPSDPAAQRSYAEQIGYAPISDFLAGETVH